jgi:hypothetical protein
VSEVGEPETWIGISADNGERIAADDFGKADESGIGVHVVVLHEPHRPCPEDFDNAVEQCLLGQSARGDRNSSTVSPLGGISADRVRGIERCIKHKAVILVEP